MDQQEYPRVTRTYSAECGVVNCGGKSKQVENVNDVLKSYDGCIGHGIDGIDIFTINIIEHVSTHHNPNSQTVSQGRVCRLVYTDLIK